MTSRWTIELHIMFHTKTDVFFERSNLKAGQFGTNGSSETLCTSFERSNQCVRGATKLKGMTPLLLWATPSWKKPFYSYKWAKVPRFSVGSVNTLIWKVISVHREHYEGRGVLRCAYKPSCRSRSYGAGSGGSGLAALQSMAVGCEHSSKVSKFVQNVHCHKRTD